MGAGHVYADPAYLAGERLREKLTVIRADGATFASVRFVAGRLDLLANREEFLSWPLPTELTDISRRWKPAQPTAGTAR